MAKLCKRCDGIGWSLNSDGLCINCEVTTREEKAIELDEKMSAEPRTPTDPLEKIEVEAYLAAAKEFDSPRWMRVSKRPTAFHPEDTLVQFPVIDTSGGPGSNMTCGWCRVKLSGRACDPCTEVRSVKYSPCV